MARKKKKKGTFWIILGLLFILAALFLVGYNLWDNERAGEESEEVIDQLVRLIPDYEPVDEEEIVIPIDRQNLYGEDVEEEMIEEEAAEDTALSAVSLSESSVPGSESGAGDTSARDSGRSESMRRLVLARRRQFYFQFPDREMPTADIGGNRYIGVLEVPSLGLSLPVMADWDMNKLRTAPCCYYGSLYKNNLVIAGHNYARHFSHLKWLDIGANIYFTDMENNRFHYQLAWVDILSPDQTAAMVGSGGNEDWDLTLYTCTTGGGSRHTLRCVMVE